MDEFQEERNAKGSRTLPERRPDRVYGLCQTTNFEDRLSSTAKIVLDDASQDTATVVQRTTGYGGEELLVQDFLQATPFHQRGGPTIPILNPRGKIRGRQRSPKLWNSNLVAYMGAT